MPRHLAVIEYDGTGFCGSQRQARGRTVQGELEQALQRLSLAEARVAMAGRTDAGVHASGQVAALDLSREMGPSELAGALNGLLARDVSVRETLPAPDAFDPRRWASRRRYAYRILNRRQRSALWERYAYQVSEALDVAAMAEAAAGLVGQHCFGAFGRPPQGDNTWRHLSRLDVTRQDEVILVVAEADAFLRRMVRMLVGALIDVGRGKKRPEELAQALGSGRQDPVSPAALAKGLVLEAVAYERQRLGLGTGLWWSCEPLLGASAGGPQARL